MNANTRDFETELQALQSELKVETNLHPEVSVVPATTL